MAEKKTYLNSIKKFKEIPLQERSNFNKQILQIEPSPNPPPVLFVKQYPDRDTFQYQGYQLNYYKLENNPKNPSSIIVHFHGFCSHGGVSGYYANIIASQCKDSNVYAFDQKNFGMSEGPCRGHIESLDDSVRQGEAFIDFILTKFEKKPKIFLSGSSFGGTVVFKMIVNSPEKYSGTILLCPALRDISQSKFILKKIGYFLGWLFPTLHLPASQSTGMGTKYNSSFTKDDKYYYNGDLIPGSVTTVLKSMEQISQLYSSLNIPYILFQAGKEKMVDPFAAIDLEQASPSQDKQTFYYDNLWHSVFYQEQIEDISQRTAQWVFERT